MYRNVYGHYEIFNSLEGGAPGLAAGEHNPGSATQAAAADVAKSANTRAVSKAQHPKSEIKYIV